jgi:hypothetical protein
MGGPTGTYVVPPGIQEIRHVIVIIHENRFFDSYFKTFPGRLRLGPPSCQLRLALILPVDHALGGSAVEGGG